MREIKFRAWDGNQHKYHYVDLFDSKMPSNWRDWYVVEQFTGITDKNGLEIFEGDILECKRRSGEKTQHNFFVSYSEESTCFVITNSSQPESLTLPLGTNPFSFLYEVIGNIHQHQYLLKK